MSFIFEWGEVSKDKGTFLENSQILISKQPTEMIVYAEIFFSIFITKIFLSNIKQKPQFNQIMYYVYGIDRKNNSPYYALCVQKVWPIRKAAISEGKDQKS